MKYALFLGCTVPARARNYEISVRKVAEALGIELVDVPDFSCCGYPLNSVDAETCLLLSARNLALAEEMGLPICTLCSACTGVLTETNRELQEHEEVRTQVNEKLGELNRAYNGGTEVKHFARILYEDVGIEKIKSSVKRDLSSLRFAAHYGCHYIKPSEIFEGFDDPEHPRSLDELIAAASASTVEYEDKIQCCGGGILAVDEDLALRMADSKLGHIQAAGADGISLVCPFCSVMYDDNQRKIESTLERTYGLPVLYYPQILGLALGFEEKELGFNMNRVKAKDLLAKIE